jgi:hypothetical protein
LTNGGQGAYDLSAAMERDHSHPFRQLLDAIR